MLQPEIVEKPELNFVGMEAAFIHSLSPDATNFAVIGPLWEKFSQRAGQVPNRIGREMFGIIYDRPKAARAHPDELLYLAAVAVNSTDKTPEGMIARTVPAGTFAVFIHRGPIRAIGATMHEIYRVWLPQSAYRHAQIADVELYDHRFCMDRDDSEMEYWISVTPKAARA